MKKYFLAAVFFAAFVPAAFGEDAAVKLIYPSDAAQVEMLDNSTESRRATPPVAEAEEVDPVTPLGQIRGVLAALENMQKSQERLEADLLELKNSPSMSDAAIKAPLSDIIEGLREAKEERAAIIKETRESIEAIKKIIGAAKTVSALGKWADVGIVILAVFAVIIGLLKMLNVVNDKVGGLIKARDEAIARRVLATAEEVKKETGANG